MSRRRKRSVRRGAPKPAAWALVLEKIREIAPTSRSEVRPESAEGRRTTERVLVLCEVISQISMPRARRRELARELERMRQHVPLVFGSIRTALEQASREVRERRLPPVATAARAA